MWSRKISIKTDASKEQVWRMWTDVSNWNVWDHQIISSNLNGEFKLGQIGELIPKNGPKSKFEIIEMSKQKSFTSRSNLPLTIMDIIHELEEVNGELIITHKVEISGMFTFLFSKLIGNKIFKHLPTGMNNLSKFAKRLN